MNISASNPVTKSISELSNCPEKMPRPMSASPFSPMEAGRAHGGDSGKKWRFSWVFQCGPHFFSTRISVDLFWVESWLVDDPTWMMFLKNHTPDLQHKYTALIINKPYLKWVI